jgi:hypothetical protein
MEFLEKRRFAPLAHAESIDDLAANLESFLADGCYIMEDEAGVSFIVEARQLFGYVGSLKIELFANEHAPPHFHVKGNRIDATFVIETCALLGGSIRDKDRKKIEYWHKHARKELVRFWNKTRPTDCPVGPIAT